MSSSVLKSFVIDIHRLKFEKNQFEFNLNNEIFQSIEDSMVEKGNIKSVLVLDKSDSMIKATFSNVGTVELICDRTLKPFDFQINTKNTIFYKFSDHYEEVSDEITLIDSHESMLDFLNPIYEFVVLAIPIKKIHPDFRRPEDDDLDDNMLIYSSVSNVEEATDANIDILDPRWEALKKLKDSL
ncbi:MAG: DUF177 domain-containing protein [Bacteroidetes bacterium]|nr:MAG: DUF177 domain-containing protein [Bacteroidota bacterium]